jgi:hypothetical protein
MQTNTMQLCIQTGQVNIIRTKDIGALYSNIQPFLLLLLGPGRMLTGYVALHLKVEGNQ